MREWKSKRKSRAFARLAFDPDSAVVRLHHLARDGQSQAHSGQMIAPLSPPVILIEDALLLLRRYARPPIRDADGHAVLFGARRYANRRVPLRIFQGVAHDLADYHPDHPGIRGNRRQVQRQVDWY